MLYPFDMEFLAHFGLDSTKCYIVSSYLSAKTTKRSWAQFTGSLRSNVVFGACYLDFFNLFMLLKGSLIVCPRISETKEDIKGIPDFWLKVLLHNSLTDVMVAEYDQPILKHLHDIKCRIVTGIDAGFIIEFHFSPNEYFSNDILTKQYIFNQSPSAESPLDYDGPEIIKCKGFVFKLLIDCVWFC